MTDRSLTDPATLRRLAEAATPGPWGAGGSIYVADGVLDIASTRCDIAIPDKQARANAAYIAAANPQTILALLDRLARAETLVAQCKATLEALHPSTSIYNRDAARLHNAMMEVLGDDQINPTAE